MMLISPLPVTPPGAGVAPFWWYSALLSTIISVSISIYSMFLHLKNYRRPQVQRLTIRILWMVPVYAVASFISLSSTSIADFVDTIRDIYEAFVIYSFFMLCVNYLGGERALLSTLEERMRTHHLWPFNLCFAPMDMSDPDTFLFVRRGVLQFVVLKPLIALVTMVLKFAGYYHEGQLTFSGAYLWVSAIYNLSVCWSLYCLVLFYVQCEIDLRPYRPMPKFICVKSVVFLTWYQGLGLAFLVWAGVIKGNDLTLETDSGEGPSRAAVIQDLLICLEMPLLALLHQFAFPWTDYND
ncbi:organic solute transporter subunit alpha/Transmembrane protein, partial [Phlyctochytrium arcticum]